MLNSDERRDLLERARAAVASAVGVGVAAPHAAAPGLAMLAGAFVTLRVRGELRGCIGYPDCDRPLVDVVQQCAVSAATADPRFPRLGAREYADATMEISVLGPIEPVSDVADIEIGRHGLIAEQGHRRGLLLPQVAAERGWSCEEFIEHTCRKAGLPNDAWRHGAKLYKFEADVFGEES